MRQIKAITHTTAADTQTGKDLYSLVSETQNQRHNNPKPHSNKTPGRKK